MDKYIENLNIEKIEKESRDFLDNPFELKTLYMKQLYINAIYRQKDRLRKYKEFRKTIEKYSVQKDKDYIDNLLNMIFDNVKTMILKRRGCYEEDFLHIYYEILDQNIEENKDIVFGILKANEEFLDILQKTHYLLDIKFKFKNLNDCQLFFDTWQLSYGGLLSFGVKRENNKITSYWVEVSMEKAYFCKDRNRIFLNNQSKGESLFYKTYKTKESAIKKISEILEANRMLGVEQSNWKREMSYKLKEIAGYKEKDNTQLQGA